MRNTDSVEVVICDRCGRAQVRSHRGSVNGWSGGGPAPFLSKAKPSDFGMEYIDACSPECAIALDSEERERLKREHAR